MIIIMQNPSYIFIYRKEHQKPSISYITIHTSNDINHFPFTIYNFKSLKTKSNNNKTPIFSGNQNNLICLFEKFFCSLCCCTTSMGLCCCCCCCCYCCACDAINPPYLIGITFRAFNLSRFSIYF